MPIENVKKGENVRIFEPVNIYGCEIGDNTFIGAFVEIQRGVKIGKNCKIHPFAFIPTGVTIGDGVFIAQHVCFSNDKYPMAVNQDGSLKKADDWKLLNTKVGNRVSIGMGAMILSGIEIGDGAVIGAGAIVTVNVPEHTLIRGNPARLHGRMYLK